MKKKIFFILTASLIAWSSVRAQEVGDLGSAARLSELLSRGVDRFECRLVYPRSSSTVVWELDSNAGELAKLDCYFSAQSPLRAFIKSVSITSYSSVEGKYPSNDLLAKERAFTFREGLNQIYGVGSCFPIRMQWVAEDWAGLRAMVAASSMERKSDIISIIDNVGIFEGREKQLEALDGGVPYGYMLREMFPQLRHIEILIEYDLSRVAEALRQGQAVAATQTSADDAVPPAPSSAQTPTEAAVRPAPSSEQKVQTSNGHFEADTEVVRHNDATLFPSTTNIPSDYSSSPIYNNEDNLARAALKALRKEDRQLVPLLAVGTDLVRAGGVMPGFEMGVPTANLSVEVYFARCWSVQGGFSYSNWKGFDSAAGHWGVASSELSPRFWLSRQGLFRGLFVGVYAQYGSYDIQKNTIGHTGTFWGAGLGVGYVQTLSKHWYLELEVRGGYRSAANELYDIEPQHNYYNRSTTENKIVPAARLSIVYRFGRR